MASPTTCAAASAAPSTAPTAEAGAPSVMVRNSGRIGYSSSDEASRRQAIDLGVNVFIEKPAKFLDIVNTVQALLGLKT